MEFNSKIERIFPNLQYTLALRGYSIDDILHFNGLYIITENKFDDTEIVSGEDPNILVSSRFLKIFVDKVFDKIKEISAKSGFEYEDSMDRPINSSTPFESVMVLTFHLSDGNKLFFDDYPIEGFGVIPSWRFSDIPELFLKEIE